MKTAWIKKENNARCILFFNGWGMDNHCVEHLLADKMDVLMFYDYADFDKNFSLDGYDEIYVVAWSMGVYVAAIFLNNKKIHPTKSIAINGTLNPIHDKFGIPPSILFPTLDNWDMVNRVKFNIRMFGGQRNSLEMKSLWSKRSVDNQYEELSFLTHCIHEQGCLEYPYDVALIGKRDLIFLYQNQVDYWKNKTKIIETDLPHFPFADVKNWEELIAL